MKFRPPHDADWPAILDIANQSVACIPEAGSQNEWLQNRRAFAETGFQHHVVLAAGSEVLGYGAAESAEQAPPDSYRLFVVVRPEHLLDYGSLIYEHLDQRLQELGAAAAWFVEYSEDHALISFILGLGYRQVKRILLDSCVAAVVLSKGFR